MLHIYQYEDSKTATGYFYTIEKTRLKQILKNICFER